MELTAAQNKFVQDLRTELPLFQQSADPRLKTPATNLEWNLKKLTGEYSGESLDAATFAQRTRIDLGLIAAALPAGAAGQAYATRAAGEAQSLFGGGASSASTASNNPAAIPGGAIPEAAPLSTDTATTTDPTATSEADVKKMLADKAGHAGEKLAWKTSVVDLLKLLGQDASSQARHRYAVALGFPEGEIGKMPSSEFNTWLHGQLLATLAQNGGALPTNLA